MNPVQDILPLIYSFILCSRYDMPSILLKHLKATASRVACPPHYDQQQWQEGSTTRISNRKKSCVILNRLFTHNIFEIGCPRMADSNCSMVPRQQVRHWHSNDFTPSNHHCPLTRYDRSWTRKSYNFVWRNITTTSKSQAEEKGNKIARKLSEWVKYNVLKSKTLLI